LIGQKTNIVTLYLDLLTAESYHLLDEKGILVPSIELVFGETGHHYETSPPLLGVIDIAGPRSLEVISRIFFFDATTILDIKP
jgi:hypothetical protein